MANGTSTPPIRPSAAGDLTAFSRSLRTLDVVEQSKGVLMEFHRCSAPAAWHLLVTAARDVGVSIPALCAAVTAVVGGSPDEVAALPCDLRAAVMAVLPTTAVAFPATGT